MSKRKETRDNHIHYILKEWGRYVNQEWKDGPRTSPNGSSWHHQIINRSDANFPDQPEYIDPESAERTAKAMIRCKKRDIATAFLLTKYYRDGWEIREIKKLRGKFWIFL